MEVIIIICFSEGCKTINDFLNKVVYDETVLMKCTKFNYEEIIDYHIILEMMEFEDIDYPILECVKCGHGGELIPIDIYSLKYKKV